MRPSTNPTWLAQPIKIRYRRSTLTRSLDPVNFPKNDPPWESRCSPLEVSKPMRSVQRGRLISATAIVAVLVLGLWLGVFAWFGGRLRTQQSIIGVAAAVAAFATLLRHRLRPNSWWRNASFLLGCLVIFAGSVAVGEVIYMRPEDLSSAAHLFISALQSRL